jgi:sialate O-acetylesterase
VYGQKVASISGPLPAGSAVKGSEVVCTFTHADGGLTAQGGELTGFVIAGADKNFVPASAKIVGDAVVVSSPDVKSPVAVRYAWAADPACTLFNGAGLPASPFRTDTFELPVAAPVVPRK